MPWLADTHAIAHMLQRKPATIRVWALRYPHLMPRQGTGSHKRALYDVEAAETIAWCLANGISPAKFATLAGLRNTEPARGSLP
jgi:hypothetical protein